MRRNNHTKNGLYRLYLCSLTLLIIGRNGYPVIALSHKLNTDNHEYWGIKWDGNSWESYKITDSNYGGLYASQPAYSGGICLNHVNTSQVYVALYENGNFEIKKFVFDDGKWHKIEDITKGSGQWNIRPVAPRNASEELEVFWMYDYYESYTKFNTIIRSFPSL